MKYKLFIILLIFNIYANVVHSKNNIAVINLESIISNNQEFIELINNIENDQSIYRKKFKKIEKELENKMEEIEKSKMILNDSEINSLIEQYNVSLTNFKNNVNEFNSFYNNQIIKIEKIIIKKIISLVETFIKNNNIEVVFDSNNYVIASNSIDITSSIQVELNKINLNLEFESFEEN